MSMVVLVDLSNSISISVARVVLYIVWPSDAKQMRVRQ